MGYDGAMLLAAIVLLIPMTAFTALALFALRKLRVVPGGAHALPAYLLVILGGYSLLFLGSAVQTLMIEPARLQRDYLGRAYGTPLTLQSYDHWGFQDPADQWRYTLSVADLAELKQRCRQVSANGPPRCTLYSNMDERWFADAWIEGRELHLIDGLH